MICTIMCVLKPERSTPYAGAGGGGGTGADRVPGGGAHRARTGDAADIVFLT